MENPVHHNFTKKNGVVKGSFAVRYIRNLSVTGRWFTIRVTISAVVGGSRPCALKMNHPGGREENRRFVAV